MKIVVNWLFSAGGDVGLHGRWDSWARFAAIKYDEDIMEFVFSARRWNTRTSSYICQWQRGKFKYDVCPVQFYWIHVSRIALWIRLLGRTSPLWFRPHLVTLAISYKGELAKRFTNTGQCLFDTSDIWTLTQAIPCCATKTSFVFISQVSHKGKVTPG